MTPRLGPRLKVIVVAVIVGVAYLAGRVAFSIFPFDLLVLVFLLFVGVGSALVLFAHRLGEEGEDEL